MSRPLDRTCELPVRGEIDHAAGEFWVANPFQMPEQGKNLSAYENNRLFLNLAGKRFVDASFASHADLDSDSRSVITGDFNRDGRPDLLVASVGGGPLRLFLNQFGEQHSGGAVRVRLRGTKSNRSAIGTRVEASVGDRRIVRDAFYQNGFQGHGPIDVLIGLGSAEQIDRLVIRWPTGESQDFGPIPVSSEIVLTQGSTDFVTIPLPADHTR